MYGRESRFELDGQLHLQWTYIQFTQCNGKLTASDLLTKKETTRVLRSSIPTLQSEKVSWLMDPPQAAENTEGPPFNSGK